MPPTDRRLSSSDRRIRSRGGRRQTDYRRETASGLLCDRCDHGIAQLVEIVSSDAQVSAVYRCTTCGREMVRNAEPAAESR